VSVQAVVLNPLQALKEQLGMSYLFVSHDLNARCGCCAIALLSCGPAPSWEQGPTERVMSAPEADYTRELWPPCRTCRCRVVIPGLSPESSVPLEVPAEA
jgi:ABC-type microcin C transport system duplicated ATPase subunit YejF